MTTNQNESKKDYLNVENVHFTTDGNKKVRMFVDYKTNITEEYVLNANLFERVENSDWKFLSGEVFFVCDRQGCITWDWDALSNLKSKSENEVYLQLRIAKLPNDDSIPGEEWDKYEQIVNISEHVVKVYYEHHFFGKNKLEIRK